VTAPVIRHALPEDVGELNELERRARLGLNGERGGQRLLELVASRNDRWFEEGVETLVSLIDDVPVGFLVLKLDDISVVESVFVHEEAREVGCGDALLGTARSIAEAFGSRRLEATALPGDRETKKSLREGVDYGESNHRFGRPQWPFQLGARFSMNAVRPSFVSSESRT
jgi:GNAT superfamily N-acetyltransferase